MQDGRLDLGGLGLCDFLHEGEQVLREGFLEEEEDEQEEKQ